MSKHKYGSGLAIQHVSFVLYPPSRDYPFAFPCRASRRLTNTC